jgi:outer membrane protein TolC
MGQPPDAALAPVDVLSVPPLPPADVAIARALAANPQLAVIDQQIAETQARASLARAMQKPDTIADAGVSFDAPPDFQYGWRVGASLTIPVLTRHRAAVRVEEATLIQLRAEREAAVSRIRGAVFASLARATAQAQAYARYRDQILPGTEEVERMAEDSYRSGQTGLVALLQAMQTARDTRLRAVQAAAEAQGALADLEQAIGSSLP